MGLTALGQKFNRNNQDKAATAAVADPYALLKKPDVGLVQITGDGDIVGFVDGKAVDDSGKPVSTSDTWTEKLKKSFFPDPRNVTADYMPYRKWRAVANIGVNALNYLGTAATAAGLVAMAGMHIPFLAVLGTGAVAAYFMKAALNPIGTWLGGNDSKKIEDDPANWMSRSFMVQAAGNAVQAVTLAVPGGYFALVPTTNAVVTYGSTTQATADTIVQNHQSLRGLGAIVGKNKKQDLATSGIGTLIGLGAAAGLAAAFGPLAPLFAIPPFLALSIWGSVMQAKSLKFDNLTNGVVRSLVHQELSGGGQMLTPDELKKQGRKLPKNLTRIDLGADAAALQADPARFKDLLSRYGKDNFIMDLTGEGKKARISVVLNNEASEQDAVKAVYQAQVLSEILASPGYQTLVQKAGDKAASLQAIQLAAGSVHGFDAIMAGLKDKNWDMSRTMMLTGSDRSIWQRNPDAPATAPVSVEQIQQFMKTGELPKTEQPS